MNAPLADTMRLGHQNELWIENILDLSANNFFSDLRITVNVKTVEWWSFWFFSWFIRSRLIFHGQLQLLSWDVILLTVPTWWLCHSWTCHQQMTTWINQWIKRCKSLDMRTLFNEWTHSPTLYLLHAKYDHSHGVTIHGATSLFYSKIKSRNLFQV